MISPALWLLLRKHRKSIAHSQADNNNDNTL